MKVKQNTNCVCTKKKAYIYNFSTGKWLLIGEDRTSDKMREILSKGSPESEILSELMQANQGTLNEKNIWRLRKIMHHYSFCTSRYVFIWNRSVNWTKRKEKPLVSGTKRSISHGLSGGLNGKEFVLYQYLDPYEFSEDGVVWTIDGKEPKIYMKEVDRTSDIQAMFFCVSALADHYIEDRKITVPLSLSAFTEEKIG